MKKAMKVRPRIRSVASLAGGLNNTAYATLTVINTTVAHNHVQGGEGGAGGNGGNGLGGGLYDYYDSASLRLLLSLSSKV